MSKKRKEEWGLFLNERNRITYNKLCLQCQRDCKQSFRVLVVDCHKFKRKENPNGRTRNHQGKNSRKIELKGKEDYDKVHHLNTVNGLHNQFKHMIRKFRGVSTIYLNRYLALFVFLMRGFDRNIAELADTVRHSLMGIRVPATLISLKSASILVI